MHFAGDAILAEFPTVSDALACAASVQPNLADRNEGLAAERKVQSRIGVNLGEIIVASQALLELFHNIRRSEFRWLDDQYRAIQAPGYGAGGAFNDNIGES